MPPPPASPTASHTARHELGHVAAGDTFRLADVNNDGRADLVYGRALDSTSVRWFVRKSNGSAFGNFSTWAPDAGDEGDYFL